MEIIKPLQLKNVLKLLINNLIYCSLNYHNLHNCCGAEPGCKCLICLLGCRQLLWHGRRFKQNTGMTRVQSFWYSLHMQVGSFIFAILWSCVVLPNSVISPPFVENIPLVFTIVQRPHQLLFGEQIAACAPFTTDRHINLLM